MNFNEFVEAVKTHFTETLGEAYTVCTNEVRKNNNVMLTGIVLRREGRRVTPNIYLNGFYEQYLGGQELDSVFQSVWTTYKEALQNFDEESFDFELEWETQKSTVVYRLINYEKNKEKLAIIPHIRFLDLAITFHCISRMADDSVSMISITSELLNYWEKDTKALLQEAVQNTPKQFPLMFAPLEQVIEAIMGEEFFQTSLPPENDDVAMYIISNEQGVNGSAAMLYEDEFQQVAEKLGGSLYILPSSIHELVLIPYSEEVEQNMLLELVKQVNEEHVPLEDILSNHIYIYHANQRSFEIL